VRELFENRWFQLGVIIFIALIPLAVLLHCWLIRRWTDRMLSQFTDLWPERCPICALHRYGVMHGHVDQTREPKPSPHDCPEGRG